MSGKQIKHVLNNWNNLQWDSKKRDNFIEYLSNMNLAMLNARMQKRVKSFLCKFNSPINVNNNSKIPKKKKKVKKIIFIIFVIILIGATAYFAYIEFRPKFKGLTIELGTNKVSEGNFLVSDMYKDHAKMVTDLTKIDIFLLFHLSI
jgi:hypothetical protein